MGDVVRGAVWRLVVSTVGTCMRNRVTGLAAEAAFFAVLSLPPLIFALAGSIGYIFAQFSDSQIDEVRDDGALPRRPGADPADGRQHHQADAQRGAQRRRPLRRRLDRLHPGAVVGLARAQRLRRHHHDHVRPRRPARHRPHPRAVVPALRARHDHRRRHHPAGRGRPDAGREVAARRGSTGSTSSTGRPSWCWASASWRTLYHVSVPVRTAWRYNLPGAVFTMFCWVFGSALLRLVLVGTARARPRSTARWPRRSPCCCGSTCSPSRCSSAPR